MLKLPRSTGWSIGGGMLLGSALSLLYKIRELPITVRGYAPIVVSGAIGIVMIWYSLRLAWRDEHKRRERERVHFPTT